ncbi:MAG: Protein translocase subunit SecY [candidate division WS2 bacterium]|nr:Protein translocase subunit SecY [Candidatus Lithacetigena glycinireducens]MBT9174396.1 Protein translocase subunit SecY [Candidatus Lithacetigena glycinireducens]
MWQNLLSALGIKELKVRFLNTLLMLALIRIGTFIPVPYIQAEKLKSLVEQGGVLGLLNLFSGGGLANASLFALGVLPYINASIIMQLLTSVIPRLEELSREEGQEGREQIQKYVRYLTVVLGTLQSYAMAVALSRLGMLKETSFLSLSIIALALTAGAMLILWLGELLTEIGIGNGVSLIIFSGIIALLPSSIISTFQLVRTGELHVFTLALGLAGSVLLLAATIFTYQAERRIPVQYARKVVGRRVYGGQSTYLPLKLIQAGVLPIIFASSFLVFPSSIAQFIGGTTLRKFGEILADPNGLTHNIIFFVLIIFFTYFYTSITFDPNRLAKDIKKYGGYIPGIRPGEATAAHIGAVLSRATFPAAVFLGLIAISPNIFTSILGLRAFIFGGTAILIVIGVALETMRQIESYLLVRHYEGLLK